MEEKRFTLRMDGELFEEISQLAKENRRSVAKEIECAIAAYLAQITKFKMANGIDDLSKDDMVTLSRRFLEFTEKSRQ